MVREDKEGLSLRNSIFSEESGLHQTRRSAGELSVGKFIFLRILFFRRVLLIFGCVGFSLLFEGFSLVAVSRGYSLVVMCGLLISVASLLVGHRL